MQNAPIRALVTALIADSLDGKEFESVKHSQENHRGVQVIGALKLVKGILLLIAAMGLFSLLRKDQSAILSTFVQHLSADPNARYFRTLIEKFLQLSPKLPLVSLGTFTYGALFSVEGVGLLMRKRWAEYLTVIVTASFLPFEIYEMVHHATVTKGIVIALNVGIVAYLVHRLRSGRSADKKGASDSFVSARRRASPA